MRALSEANFEAPPQLFLQIYIFVRITFFAAQANGYAVSYATLFISFGASLGSFLFRWFAHALPLPHVHHPLPRTTRAVCRYTIWSEAEKNKQEINKFVWKLVQLGNFNVRGRLRHTTTRDAWFRTQPPAAHAPSHAALHAACSLAAASLQPAA